MDKDLITTVVEVPESHVPKLEVTMSDLLRESNQNREMTVLVNDFFGKLDFSNETPSLRFVDTVAHFPGVNDLQTSFAFLNVRCKIIETIMTKVG